MPLRWSQAPSSTGAGRSSGRFWMSAGMSCSSVVALALRLPYGPSRLLSRKEREPMSTGGGALTRRVVLLGGLAAAAGARLPWPSGAVPWGSGDPFTLGVASGDPWPGGMVLWTRLAPQPLAEDGRGGMPRRAVPVQWQLAEGERFRRGVPSRTAPA